MTTIRQAQCAIDKAGIPLEIVRGEGYHYFIYDVPARDIFESVSIYVPYTKTYSAAEWANQAGLVFTDILERRRARGDA
jgi:hypothetical protein